MGMTADQALQHGIAAHNSGNIKEAERVYRGILQTQPTHPDANHNLGVIAASVNNTQAALLFTKESLLFTCCCVAQSPWVLMMYGQFMDSFSSRRSHGFVDLRKFRGFY